MIDDALLLAARVLLRVYSPMKAHAALRAVGHLLPARTTHEGLRLAALRLRGGSCLSRSLALAARAPFADVVIGVDLVKSADLLAHAWLELGRVPLSEGDPKGSEIARLSCAKTTRGDPVRFPDEQPRGLSQPTQQPKDNARAESSSDP